MKRNYIWVIEGKASDKCDWEPVYGEFYYKRKDAVNGLPSQFVGYDGTRVRYRIHKYVAEVEK